MNILEIADIIGMGAFALSGFYVGSKKKLDFLGIFIAGFLTALGGGIMRDTIADRVPYTFSNLLPGIVVISVITLAIVAKLHKHDQVEKRFLFVFSDALGLISFTISGVLIGIEANFNFFGIVLLGLTTAVGGGILRDILLNEVPWVLQSGLYGTISLVIGCMMYAISLLGFLNSFVIIIVFIFGVIFRMIAYYRGWHLPILE